MEQNRVGSSPMGFSNPTALQSNSTILSPTFSRARLNSRNESNDNSVDDSVEHEESKRNDSPSPTSPSSSSYSSSLSSSASYPRGQFLGNHDSFLSFGRSKRASESDSAEWASWDEMEWSVSWKNPSCKEAESRPSSWVVVSLTGRESMGGHVAGGERRVGRERVGGGRRWKSLESASAASDVARGLLGCVDGVGGGAAVAPPYKLWVEDAMMWKRRICKLCIIIDTQMIIKTGQEDLITLFLWCLCWDKWVKQRNCMLCCVGHELPKTNWKPNCYTNVSPLALLIVHHYQENKSYCFKNHPFPFSNIKTFLLQDDKIYIYILLKKKKNIYK